jgi:anti-anti-sigma factor
MGLEVNTIKVNDVVVVKLLGNLDTNTAPDAEEEINKSLDEGTQKMIINL